MTAGGRLRPEDAPGGRRLVGSFDDYMLLTPEEASAMVRELCEVMGRYRSPEGAGAAPETAHNVTVQLAALRTPGDET